MNKRKKRKKKGEKEKLRDQADKLWAEKVKKIGKCEYCGSTESLHAHHFFPKNRNACLRYTIFNGVCLCSRCHFKHHRGYSEIHVGIVLKRGGEWYHNLYQLKERLVSKTVKYYQEIIRQLE